MSSIKTKFSEIIFTNGDHYFQHLFKDIDFAHSNIDLETYIFNHDSLGIAITEKLINAAKRGVQVRILVDGAGTPIWGDSLTKKMEMVGIKTRIFHPFPWRLWHWSRSVIQGPTLLKAIYHLLKINSRNHRKVCIIDNKIAYVGSLNISQCHLTKDNGGDHWRDTGIRLENTDINELKNAFESAWNQMPVQERIREIFREIRQEPIFRLNNSRHRRRILYKNLLRRIDHCKKRIWITNAYFVPDSFLLKQLIEAAQNGVDVRILLPQKSDVPMMPWASAMFYHMLLKAGVRIFEYIPSMLHAKSLILDDWVSVGSSNLNSRSLLHDLEIDVYLQSPESKKIVTEQFLKDINDSLEIQFDNWYKRPFYQRFIGRLLLYMKYWI